jgi:AcrR family transcriptional regulator
VAATQQLLREGRPSPSVDEIAAAADVSRRTVYMYFPTLDQLVLDAAVGSLSSTRIEAAFESASDDDALARVDALVRAILDEAVETLPIGRQIIRLTIDQAEDEPSSPNRPRRGFRRVQWLERALEPLRPQLSAEQFDRLISALAVVVGWEAMTVLRDVRGLDAETERQVSTWAAKALIEAVLAETTQPA